MRARSDEIDLEAELRALRQEPGPEFAAELDRRAAEGFAGDASLAERLRTWLRSLSPRQIAIPAGALTLAALVAVTAVISLGERDEPAAVPQKTLSGELGAENPEADRGGVQHSDVAPSAAASQPSESIRPFSRRKVERDAELTLRSAPDEVGKDARRVFTVVGDAGGIVLNSSIRDRGADAGARFLLLVPASRLGRTLADLSQIADVASRNESTADITAPTVGVEDRLSDSTARIDGLLAQLAGADSDEERAAVETELRRERRRAAVLRSRLERLRQRGRYARVTVNIESGEGAAPGSAFWGVDDALDDAGRVLTIAIGVLLIALAVLVPLAAIALLAWLATRTWVHHRRRQALN